MRRWLILALLLTACGAQPEGLAPQPLRYKLAHSGPGAMLLMGGGSDVPALFQHLIALAGGPSANIVVVPFSGVPAEGPQYVALLKGLGAAHVVALPSTPSNPASAIATIQQADALFFTGGQPQYLLGALGPYLSAVRAAWQSGCVLSGTSAGAMVWGDRTILAGESADALAHGTDASAGGLEVASGEGLLPHLTIDPHFAQRARFNRLWVETAQTGTLGLGIDESTAAWITPDGQVSCLGAGTVTVIRPGSPGAQVTVLQGKSTIPLAQWLP